MPHTRPPRTVPPGPPIWSLPRFLSTLRKKGPPVVYRQWHQRYGDVVRFPFPGGYRYLVCHPQAVKDILTDSTHYSREIPELALFMQLVGKKSVFALDGPEWLLYRRAMQPAFDKEHLACYSQVFIENSAAWIDRWRVGDTLDMKRELTRLALQNVCQPLFSTTLDELDTIADCADAIAQYITRLILAPIPLPLFVAPPVNRRFKQALHHLYGLLDQMIETRRAMNVRPDDLISVLLQKTEEGSFSNEVVRSQLMTMLLAGHETAASTVAWAFYLLTQHPAIARQVEQEVEAVLRGALPTVAVMEQLPLTRRVIDETLRLYPASMGTARVALSDRVINGYHIPKGAVVQLDFSILHMREEVWGQDAHAFRPDRCPVDHGSAYLPFSLGGKRCLGERFALQEAVLILAMVLQRFRLELAPAQNIYPQFLGTWQPNQLQMVLRSRKDPSATP